MRSAGIKRLTAAYLKALRMPDLIDRNRHRPRRFYVPLLLVSHVLIFLLLLNASSVEQGQ